MDLNLELDLLLPLAVDESLITQSRRESSRVISGNDDTDIPERIQRPRWGKPERGNSGLSRFI